MIRSTKRPRVCAALLALTCASASLADEKKIARAREILDLFLSGQYAEFCATGDETVRSKFNAAMARQVMATIEFQIGTFKKVDSAEHSKRAGFAIAEHLKGERESTPPDCVKGLHQCRFRALLCHER